MLFEAALSVVWVVVTLWAVGDTYERWARLGYPTLEEI